jgi:hypothetical protein
MHEKSAARAVARTQLSRSGLEASCPVGPKGIGFWLYSRGLLRSAMVAAAGHFVQLVIVQAVLEGGLAWIIDLLFVQEIFPPRF